MRKSMNVTTHVARTHAQTWSMIRFSGKIMLKPKVPSSNPATGRGKMPE
jgi:hypothetical protein